MPVLDEFWMGDVHNGINPTEMLIGIMKQERFKKLIDSASGVQIKLWEMVASELSRMGAWLPCPTRRDSGLSCSQKWAHLVRKYKEFKKQVEETNDMSNPPQFFHDMDEIMTSRKNVYHTEKGCVFGEIADQEVSSSNSVVEQAQSHGLTFESDAGKKALAVIKVFKASNLSIEIVKVDSHLFIL